MGKLSDKFRTASDEIEVVQDVDYKEGDRSRVVLDNSSDSIVNDVCGYISAMNDLAYGIDKKSNTEYVGLLLQKTSQDMQRFNEASRYYGQGEPFTGDLDDMQNVNRQLRQLSEELVSDGKQYVAENHAGQPAAPVQEESVLPDFKSYPANAAAALHSEQGLSYPDVYAKDVLGGWEDFRRSAASA